MIACHECDLLIELPTLQERQKAFCPRCHYLLSAKYKNSINRILVFSSCGLFFLVLALSFPFLIFNTHGIERVIDLRQSIEILAEQHYLSLTILLYVSIIIIPVLFLLGIFYISLAIKLQVLLPATKKIMQWLQVLLPWSMVEIFLIGVLVSFIKIISLADVALGLSFLAFVLFALCLTIVTTHLDKYQFWLKINAMTKKCA